MEQTELQMEKAPSDSTASEIRKFETETYVEVLEWWFKNPRVATLAWVGFCVTYWAILVLLPCIITNDLSNYEFALWIFGMMGVCAVYYSVKAGHPADSPGGKPVVAFTCLLMSIDWIAHAYSTLEGYGSAYNYILMFFHSIGMLWASLFFYNRAVKSGERLAWLTLLIEWLDLIFMCIVILIIQNNHETCFDNLVCWGYFMVLSLDLLIWFFPIMFGLSDTERNIHIHMIILDCCTDLPLVIIIITSSAYTYHWFLFIDIALKLILVLRSLAYHGLYSLVLAPRMTDGNSDDEAVDSPIMTPVGGNSQQISAAPDTEIR